MCLFQKGIINASRGRETRIYFLEYQDFESCTFFSNHSIQVGMLIVLCAVAIWSTTPVFIDQLQTAYQLTALQISTWCALLVTVFLALYLLVRRPSVFKLQRREIGYYVLYGVVGVSLFNLAFNTSVAINKSAVATTLMFCAPVFVALGSWWVFHERLKPA